MWSIRWRLILSLGVASLLVFGVAGASVVFFTKKALHRGVDQRLKARVDRIISRIEVEDGELELEHDDYEGEHNGNVSGLKYRIWQDGYIIGQSDDFLIPGQLDPATMSPAPPRKFDLRWSRDERVRVRLHCMRLEELGLPRVDFAGSVLTIFVATESSWIDETISTLISIVSMIAAIASALVLSLVYWLTVRGLQPLNQLADEIGKIDVGQSRTHRLSVPDQAVETATVVDQVQALLDRFRDVRERERAFSADVSHELRTPLAGLASILEVTADEVNAIEVGSSETEAAQRAHRLDNIEKCRNIVDSMTKMVGVLLSLNRLDGDSCQFDCAHIDVLDYVEDCFSAFESIVEARKLSLSLNIDKSVQIFTDPDFFILILTNLFKNAVTYCDNAGSVTVSAVETDDEVRIIIENTGADLNEGDLSRIFERFWRKDQVRTVGAHRFGLGLSLVKRMQRHLSGTVAAELPRPGVFSIVLSYPVIPIE